MKINKEQRERLQRKTLVVGLGHSGQAVLHFLAGLGVAVAAADTRSDLDIDPLRSRYPALEITLGPLEAAFLSGFERIVLSPGVSRWHPAVEAAAHAGVEVVGDIELFSWLVDVPIVAITGSNGKSTVTTLVAEMAAKAGVAVRAGGNLGTPVMELLQEKLPELYVLELSSFQLESVHHFSAAAAVVLNISPDHLDRYRDLDHYAETKMRIYHRAVHSVLATDDLWIERWLERRLQSGLEPPESITRFGLDVPQAGQFGISLYAAEPWLFQGEEALLPVSAMKMKGEHSWRNALAALALGDAVGLPRTPMLEVLQTFVGLPHRTEWLGEHAGVGWINDSKGTNVGATEAAIAGLSASLNGKLIWIAGGQGKGADFSPLRSWVEAQVRCAVLLGEDRQKIAAALGGVVPVQYAAGMEEAVAVATACAQPGDTVLLSPACASFDQFTGFEARGDAFRHALSEQLGVAA